MTFFEKFLMPDKTIITEWVIIAVIAIFSIIATANLKEKPGKLQNIAEMAVSKLLGFFEGVLGEHAREFFPMMGTFFVFIVVCNYCGELPGSGHVFTVPTSVLAVTVALGLVAFCTIHGAGFKHKGFGGYLKSFLTAMLPLTLLETFVRPVSLMLRLYGNLFGEEQVVETLAELFPVGLPLIMNVLSLLFCLIQAMIFTMLTSIFILEAIEEEAPNEKKAAKKAAKAAKKAAKKAGVQPAQN